MNALQARAIVGHIHRRRLGILNSLRHIWGDTVPVRAEHGLCKCFAETVLYDLDEMRVDLARLEGAIADDSE